MNKKILVIGSLNMDLIIRVDHIPGIGETIVGSDITRACGGKGANQALACGKLGGDVMMLGAVGADAHGDQLLNNLESGSVDVSRMLRLETIGTGTAIINVDSHGNNNIVVISGANRYCSKEYLMENEALISGCDIVLLQMEIPLDAVEYAIDTAYRCNKKIILNPAPAPKQFNLDLLSKVDIITPNETELELISGYPIKDLEDVKHACSLLLEKGAKQIIVTMGSKGAYTVDQSGFHLYDAFKVNVVDTTAAGDTFNGALAVMLAEQASDSVAIQFANKAAALSVQKEGAQTSIPERKEVENF